MNTWSMLRTICASMKLVRKWFRIPSIFSSFAAACARPIGRSAVAPQLAMLPSPQRSDAAMPKTSLRKCVTLGGRADAVQLQLGTNPIDVEAIAQRETNALNFRVVRSSSSAKDLVVCLRTNDEVVAQPKSGDAGEATIPSTVASPWRTT